MRTLDETSLTPLERRVVDRFITLLQEELGHELHGVWLYGSRARGEPVREESDVDLIVVAEREGWDEQSRIGRILDRAADAERASPVWYSVHVYTPEHVAQRREIRSFFIQEVDRDKVVLVGER